MAVLDNLVPVKTRCFKKMPCLDWNNGGAGKTGSVHHRRSASQSHVYPMRMTDVEKQARRRNSLSFDSLTPEVREELKREIPTTFEQQTSKRGISHCAIGSGDDEEKVIENSSSSIMMNSTTAADEHTLNNIENYEHRNTGSDNMMMMPDGHIIIDGNVVVVTGEENEEEQHQQQVEDSPQYLIDPDIEKLLESKFQEMGHLNIGEESSSPAMEATSARGNKRRKHHRRCASIIIKSDRSSEQQQENGENSTFDDNSFAGFDFSKDVVAPSTYMSKNYGSDDKNSNNKFLESLFAMSEAKCKAPLPTIIEG